MVATALKFLAGFVTKEVLTAAFREIIVEFALDRLKEFVKSTDNKYDDELVEKFAEFIEKYEPVG
jgi:hypothetical protein